MTAFNLAMEDCEAILEPVADKAVSAVLASEHFDLVSEFCAPFAEASAALLMGFPTDDAGRIAKWSNDFFRLFHVSQNRETFLEVDQAVGAFRAYVEGLVANARANGGQGFLGRVVESSLDGMSDRALADNLMLIASDAIENVRAGLAVCALALIRQPELAKAAVEDDGIMRGVIEEAMRLEAPGQYQGRITTGPVEIAGKVIPSHSLVLLSFAAANRDPDAFPEPQNFRPGRKDRRPLTFGGGPHACLGRALVFRQFAVALTAFIKGGRVFEADDSELKWSRRAGHRWLERLVVTGRAASAID